MTDPCGLRNFNEELDPLYESLSFSHSFHCYDANDEASPHMDVVESFESSPSWDIDPTIEPFPVAKSPSSPRLLIYQPPKPGIIINDPDYYTNDGPRLVRSAAPVCGADDATCTSFSSGAAQSFKDLSFSPHNWATEPLPLSDRPSKPDIIINVPEDRVYDGLQLVRPATPACGASPTNDITRASSVTESLPIIDRPPKAGIIVPEDRVNDGLQLVQPETPACAASPTNDITRGSSVTTPLPIIDHPSKPVININPENHVDNDGSNLHTAPLVSKQQAYPATLSHSFSFATLPSVEFLTPGFKSGVQLRHSRSISDSSIPLMHCYRGSRSGSEDIRFFLNPNVFPAPSHDNSFHHQQLQRQRHQFLASSNVLVPELLQIQQPTHQNAHTESLASVYQERAHHQRRHYRNAPNGLRLRAERGSNGVWVGESDVPGGSRRARPYPNPHGLSRGRLLQLKRESLLDTSTSLASTAEGENQNEAGLFSRVCESPARMTPMIINIQQNVTFMLSTILKTTELYKCLLLCKGADAQKILDGFQLVSYLYAITVTAVHISNFLSKSFWILKLFRIVDI
ncbi:hypothetical protein C0989_002619 [Termitomyces sp. Mn162]|nr:hypothetical protein C0989_002619 [Termitomyces sp. Mn162]